MQFYKRIWYIIQHERKIKNKDRIHSLFKAVFLIRSSDVSYYFPRSPLSSHKEIPKIK